MRNNPGNGIQRGATQIQRCLTVAERSLGGSRAVGKRWAGASGIGALMVKKIARDAVQSPFAVRVLRCAAEPDSIGFYQRIGFIFATERDNKKRNKPHMFIDIQAIFG